eukprot:4434107-Amphidinium_carterae.1
MKYGKVENSLVALSYVFLIICTHVKRYVGIWFETFEQQLCVINGVCTPSGSGGVKPLGEDVDVHQLFDAEAAGVTVRALHWIHRIPQFVAHETLC